VATAVAVAVSMGVVVPMGGASVVVVSTGEAFVVAVSTEAFLVAVAISAQCEAAIRSAAAELVGGVAATGVAIGAATIADSLMMSSSATSAFRGGAGAIRTVITVTTIIRTIIMDTAITRTIIMDTAGTVTTTVAVMDTTMAADQGIFGGCGVGNKRGLRLLELAFRPFVSTQSQLRREPSRKLSRDIAMREVDGGEVAAWIESDAQNTGCLSDSCNDES
jgi:hypothetical protein